MPFLRGAEAGAAAACEHFTNTANGPWRTDGERAGGAFVLRGTPSARPNRRANFWSPAM
jgi:hypothetical protein